MSRHRQRLRHSFPVRDTGFRFPQAAVVALPSIPIETNSPFLIALQTGWNMVGYPFPTNIPLSSVLVSLYVQGPVTWSYQAASAAGWVGPTVWAYGGGAYFATDQLSPYQGCWVYANQNCTLVVPPPT